MTGWYQRRWSQEPWADALLKGAFYLVVWLVVGVAIVLGLAVWTRADPDPGVFRGAAVSLLFGWVVRLLYLLVKMLVLTARAGRSGMYLDEMVRPPSRRQAPTPPDAVPPAPVASPQEGGGSVTVPVGAAAVVAAGNKARKPNPTREVAADEPRAVEPGATASEPGEPFCGGELDPRVSRMLDLIDYPQTVTADGTVLNLADPDRGEYAYRITWTDAGLDVEWIGERRSRDNVGTFASLEALEMWLLGSNMLGLRTAMKVNPALITARRWGPGAQAPGTEVAFAERSQTLSMGGEHVATFAGRLPNSGISEAVVLSWLMVAGLDAVVDAVTARGGGNLFHVGPYAWVMADRTPSTPVTAIQVPDPARGGAADLASLIEHGLTARKDALDFMATFLGANVAREYTTKPGVWDDFAGERYLVVWLGTPRDRGWGWNNGTGADAVVQTNGECGLAIRHGSHTLLLAQRFVSAYVDRARREG